MNIEATRIRAVDCKELNISPLEACALSHRVVIEHAILSHHKNILILEDDAQFVDNFIDEFSTVMSEIPQDWQMIHFGSAETRGKMISDRVKRSTYALTSHAIAMDQSVFSDFLAANRLDRHVDEVYGSLMEKVNAYTVHPSIIKQAAGYSDISNLTMSYDHLIH